ncbi:DUF4823 domain-containing protein [Pseudomonas fluorescens]|uniref:DUF4823 domain-containing protein n=1 Tax=Pseudomonas fluorescens TaxID=294 RepID=UPI003D02E08A
MPCSLVARTHTAGYGDNVYSGSGRNTTKIIYNATSAKSRLVRIGGLAENFEDAVARAQREDQDIFIFPTILHWEDRATEWSMIPDSPQLMPLCVIAKSISLSGSVL